ncbi:MAG: cytochrome b/b6 domain-containing protein [Gammaproteobacteria bacterium]|nr:cytochrome b/b6 domain-containing protein [Gammaproteobacteria bacterium]
MLHNSVIARSLGTTLVAGLILWAAAPAWAQDLDCGRCHDDVTFTSSAHPDLACADCHTNVTRQHRREGVEPLSDEESCGQCHGGVLRSIGRSVHGDKAACIDCHGAPHNIHEADDLASAVSPVNQIKSCGGCHNDPPELVDGYLTSEHGKALLLSGLISAPSCSDCHGDHRIMETNGGRAPTSHANSPDMCGSCHLLLLDDWKNHSAHGFAWQAGEDGPVCVDCHESHSIADPTTDSSRQSSAGNCGGCHEEYSTSFGDSFHGKATQLGMSGGAVCADCHTPHKNLPADHPESSVHPDNVLETCGNCHEGITPSFATFDPHNDPTNPDDIFAVYVVWVFMTSLLVGVFIFFGVHDALWLQRSLVGVLRGEFDEERYGNSGKYIQRFRRKNMRMHVVIITTFILLALTGLPLKFHGAPWAQQLVDILGGIDSTRFIHRVAAIGTFGYMFVHILDVFVRSVFKKERGMFWGPNSMTPQPKDFFDFIGNIRYFLYMGERPPGDRWTYFEKFDYLAVFWGVMMIGVSGLFLWFPDFFTSFLPGWTLNAAFVIHSDEALLATGFIFFFHFFHTHLRPESFPMDLVIFTGRMSLERFKSERPLEYERLVANNELEDYLVEGPNPRQRRDAYIFGSIFLTIGILLAIGIVWALLKY